jgi:hypothetical protein
MDLNFLVKCGEQFLQALKESREKVKGNICKHSKSRVNKRWALPAGKGEVK